MRHILYSAAALALLSSGAMAADLIVDTPTVAPAAAADNWTGFYLGVHGGYLWSDLLYESDDDYGWSPEGGFIGAQAGYNWQIDQFVLGVEGDVSYGGWAKGAYSYQGELYEDEDYYVASPEWFGTLRGRIGYDFDGILPYLTAGLAVASVHVEDDEYPEDATHVGFAVGAGVEAKLDDNWSVKAEYIYADLGSQDYYDDPVALTSSTVKVGLNFGF